MENEEITLQCSLPLPCSEVVLVANEEKVKEEDNKQEEEVKIRTIMQSSVAMQESCTRKPRQSFFRYRRGGEEGAGIGVRGGE